MTDHVPHGTIPLKEGEGEWGEGNYVENFFFPLKEARQSTCINYQGVNSDVKLLLHFFQKATLSPLASVDF